MKNETELLMPKEETARAVYRRADQLERRWQAAGLSPDFRDRMTDAVFRQLTRFAELGDRSGIEEASGKFACRLLDMFWVKNARRDCSRRVHRLVPLDESIADQRNSFDQIHDADAIMRLTQRIVSYGVKHEVAIAFVLNQLGLTSERTAHLLGRASQTRVTAAAIRQWSRRRFPSIRSTLLLHSDSFHRLYAEQPDEAEAHANPYIERGRGRSMKSPRTHTNRPFTP
jgi:hypothetical protein